MSFDTTPPAAIRPLDWSDREVAIQLLLLAFDPDPILRYWAADADPTQVYRCVFEAILTFCQPYGQVWGAYHADGSLLGLAAWIPPDVDADDELGWLSAGLYRLPLLISPHRWTGWIPMLSLGQRLPKPAWSLQLLGVDPQVQGQGIGSRLLQPVLARSDQTGIPCHLETSTEGAVRFYQRQGFEVLHQRTFKDPSLPYWTMLRAVSPSGLRATSVD